MKAGAAGNKLIRQLARNARGQAMTEYVLLVLLVALVSIPIARALPKAVRGYVKPFYYCISRPYP